MKLADGEWIKDALDAVKRIIGMIALGGFVVAVFAVPIVAIYAVVHFIAKYW